MTPTPPQRTVLAVLIGLSVSHLLNDMLQARFEPFAAHRLARFGAADLEHVAAGRRGAEVVIERDDAVLLGLRQVEAARDGVDRRRRHQLRVDPRRTGQVVVLKGARTVAFAVWIKPCTIDLRAAIRRRCRRASAG